MFDGHCCQPAVIAFYVSVENAIADDAGSTHPVNAKHQVGLVITIENAIAESKIGRHALVKIGVCIEFAIFKNKVTQCLVSGIHIVGKFNAIKS